jgi:hypothetical protein
MWNRSNVLFNVANVVVFIDDGASGEVSIQHAQ